MSLFWFWAALLRGYVSRNSRLLWNGLWELLCTTFCRHSEGGNCGRGCQIWMVPGWKLTANLHGKKIILIGNQEGRAGQHGNATAVRGMTVNNWARRIQGRIWGRGGRRRRPSGKRPPPSLPPSLPPSPCFNRCAICSAKGGVAWTAKLLNRLCFDLLQKEGEVYFLSTRSVTPSNISVKKILHYGNFLAEYNVQMRQMDYLLQYGLRNRAAQRFCSFGWKISKLPVQIRGS